MSAQATLSLTARAPLVARKQATRPAGRRPLAVRAASGPEEALLSRRSLAALLALPAALLPARRAAALIPDDDDEDLVKQARANRRSKLASERSAEQAFARSEGFADRSLEKELIPVQKAINALARTGSQLEAGDAKAAAATLSDGWQGEFKSASTALSYNEAAQATVGGLLSSLAALESAAKRGSLPEAKSSFVSAVAALQGWTSAAGIAGSLKGL